MKTTFHYTEKTTLLVHALGITATIDYGQSSLAETLDYIDCIFNNATMFHGKCVDYVHIINSETGELIAECHPDRQDSSPEDWDYNEDLGFDPYLGCYTDDC